MSYRNIIKLFLCVLLSLSSFPTLGQTTFSYMSLESLAQSLQDVKLPNRDSVFRVPMSISPRPLVVRYDSLHRVSQLGVHLFDTREYSQTKIFYDFAERFILYLLLQEKNSKMSEKLAEWHCSLFYNSKNYGASAFLSLHKVLSGMKAPIDYSLQIGTNTVKILWIWEQNQQMELIFPLNRELIEGSNLKEADQSLFLNIQEMGSKKNYSHQESIVDLDVLDQQHSLYINWGESLPTHKSLNSNRYYIRKGKDYKMAFTSVYPFYSLTNLFLGSDEAKRVNLKFTHIQYGKSRPKLEIPVAVLYDLFSPDFKIFCNAGLDKEKKMEIFVIFSHKYLNYIHLLKASISKEELFLTDKPIIEGLFYSYIPINDLKSMIK